MSIELQLTTGDEEWTFNLAEAVVPSPGRLEYRQPGRGPA